MRSDVLVTELVKFEPRAKQPCGNTGPGGIEGQAKRRAQVRELMLQGIKLPTKIAELIGCDARTVRNDIKAFNLEMATQNDTETMRDYLNVEVKEIFGVAKERYIEGKNTVDGRIALDAASRLAKQNGIDETKVNVMVQGPLVALAIMAQQQEETIEGDYSEADYNLLDDGT